MKIVSPILIFIAFALLLFLPSDNKEKISTLRIELTKLQSGDLIFRKGRSLESHIVLTSDNKCKFSHVGIIYFENTIPFVIHAVPGENKHGKDYIRKETVSDYLAPDKASKYSVYRSDLGQAINEHAAMIAYYFYEKKYLFDNKYDLVTSDKLYCTELIQKAFQQASNQALNINTTRVNILFGAMELIMPGNIIENPHFQNINNL